jgi:hypothetical protein
MDSGGPAKSGQAGGVVGRGRWGGETTRDSPALGLWAWLGAEGAGESTPRHSRAVAAGSSTPARQRLGGRSERAGELS